MRITTPEVLAVAKRVFLDTNKALVQALEAAGTRARAVNPSVFESIPFDPKVYGLVGKVVKVHLDMVMDNAQRAIPVIMSLGETAGGQLLNINADVAAVELAKAVQPLKVVYINETGGLCDGDGNLMRNINFPEDLEYLSKQPWFRYGLKLKVREIGELLKMLPPSSSVSVTSPQNLMRELFTHQGEGTLCRRQDPLRAYTSLAGLDLNRLKVLLEGSFARTLNEGYFKSLESRLLSLYVDDSYDACAIVTKEPGAPGVAYLDKFSVTPEQQGKGSAGLLWTCLRNNHPQLYWRSRTNNPINSWYFSKADGSLRITDHWMMFWYGLDPAKDIVDQLPQNATLSACYATCKQLPGSFTTSGHSTPSGKREFHSSSRSSSAVSQPSKRYRVGLLGARGYVGAELAALVEAHPSFDIVLAGSRALKGTTIGEFLRSQADLLGRPKRTDYRAEQLRFVDLNADQIGSATREQGIDLWFFALPNGLCAPYVDAVGTAASIVDLSADHRFVVPTSGSLAPSSSGWVYGFPERYRQSLKGARRISNPGCYATGAQAALLPLVANSLLAQGQAPSVFGVSGYSGAGTSPSRKNDVKALHDNLMPYSLVNHIHEREVSTQLGARINFMPHVAQHFRGIALTVSAELSKSTTADELLALYSSHYNGERLIRVQKEIPEVADIKIQHHVSVGGFAANGSHVVICATIDNLLKGAATQALQNANLSLGLPEFTGLA
eukprot:TRINITY_DN7382_c0_g1_i1.p1 TRINITY_DN7382_c0_g1~~TRINITY_DN7382_c0_g1_i1.p1  ORF type:complete len:851 (-),score=169.87 TRINITY_DN7382_c0_g1_i1:44-2215(-)